MAFVGILFQYIVPWILFWDEILQFVVFEVNMATNICNVAFRFILEHSVTGYGRELFDRLWQRTVWQVVTENCVTDCDSGEYEKLWQNSVWCYDSVEYDGLWLIRAYQVMTQYSMMGYDMVQYDGY